MMTAVAWIVLLAIVLFPNLAFLYPKLISVPWLAVYLWPFLLMTTGKIMIANSVVKKNESITLATVGLFIASNLDTTIAYLPTMLKLFHLSIIDSLTFIGLVNLAIFATVHLLLSVEEY